MPEKRKDRYGLMTLQEGEKRYECVYSTNVADIDQAQTNLLRHGRYYRKRGHIDFGIITRRVVRGGQAYIVYYRTKSVRHS